MEKLFYIGTYTEGTKSRGIYSAMINENGEVDGMATETNRTVVNPSYMAVNGDRLYAVEECDAGSLVTFGIGDDGALTEIGRTNLPGSGYCHVTAYPDGKFVSASAYVSSGVSVCPVNFSGVAGDPVAGTAYEGKGKDKERQEAPHTHSSQVTPNGKWLLVSDLGLDKIFIYESAPAGKDLKEHAVIEVEAGSGPRHFCFNEEGTKLYVLCELSNRIFAYDFNAEKGSTELIGSYSTLPEGFAGENTAADIHLSSNGNFLYASNRGYDSIAVFQVLDDGKLQPADICKLDIKGPRSFAIVDIYMIIAGQVSNNVVVYRLNQENGKLRDRISYISVPSPVCICVKQ